LLSFNSFTTSSDVALQSSDHLVFVSTDSTIVGGKADAAGGAQWHSSLASGDSDAGPKP
jgi:hypothetical protein